MKPSYWAVLPAKVRYDEELRPNAKLIYAEITALSDSTGFCWASNEYLANLFGISKKTVSALISQLAGKGYIAIEIVKDDRGAITERRLFVDRPTIMDTPIPKNGDTPKNEHTPIPKNGDKNNINNISLPPKVPQRGTHSKKEHLEKPDWMPERFLKLWDYYPHDKRGNKQRAMRAWDKLQPSDELIAIIGRAMLLQFSTTDWQRGVGVPHVSTYLNSCYWEDAEGLNAPAAAIPDSGTFAPDPEVM